MFERFSVGSEAVAIQGGTPWYMSIGVGALGGLLASLYAISFAGIIFSGPLTDYFVTGMQVFLLGALIAALAPCFGRPYRGELWQAQSVSVVILAVIATRVIAGSEGAPVEAIFATITILIALITILTGVLMFTVGALRLAKIAKSIPYPVVAGFLAATGVYLVLRAIEVNTGTRLSWRGFSETGMLARGSIPICVALIMLFAERWFRSVTIIIVTMLAVTVLVFGGLAANGLSLSDARALGLMLDANFAPAAHEFSWAFAPEHLPLVDTRLILAQAPLIATVALIAVLGSLVNLSAIEMTSGENYPLDAELRKTGVVNMITGAAGGLIGYSSTTLSALALNVSPRPDRLVPITAAAVALGALLTGPLILPYLPRDLFSVLLAYLGLGFLQKWLIVERPRMPREDYLTLLLILGVTLVAGFVWAMVLGIVLASLRFTIAYARLPAFHSAVTGAIRRSSTERSERAAILLATHGHETLIFEIQGYIFFGTANTIYEQILEAISTGPNALMVRNLVIDFKRVQGMDVSAVQMLNRLKGQIERRKIRLRLSGLGPDHRKRVENTLGADPTRFCATLDDALTAIEESILERAIARGEDHEIVASESSLMELLNRTDASGARVRFETRRFQAGSCLFEQGIPADCFLILEEGRLFASVKDGNGRATRVATFLPGSAVGEIGFLTGSVRTASIHAETDSAVRIVTREGLEELRARDPGLALDLQELLSRLLAQRLTRTTAHLFAIDV